MIALGLVLIVLCVALGAGVVLSNTEPLSAQVFGVSLSNVSIGGLFLLGAILGALAMIGLGLVLVGTARTRGKRVAHKREERERATLAQENSRLQAELGSSGETHPTAPDRSTSTDPGRGR